MKVFKIELLVIDHRTYRAKLAKDPARNDLHLAKHRSKHWIKKAKATPQTPWSALFAGRLPLNAEG